MAWKPGESGNPNGRPKKENTLIDALLTELDKPYRESTKREAVVCKIIDLGLDGDVRALGKLFNIIQRDFEFSKNEEIEERIKRIESRLDDMGAK